ncbi:small membrane A-kinase anchor protein [Scleropages formosus]|uniref:Small membrane A-kinase anchor protein n=1 Tax=Scleropages formosus TaxID=113540 RepID=A0A8C9RFE6_SCLFO|nr:small membrane A-kinase anchor protein [Scleropages formosus]
MGCVKSKHGGQTPDASSVEKAGSRQENHAGEKAVLVSSEVGPGHDRPPVDPALLDYAERLSEDIVARAVQQWAELDSRYSDIPYIECDVP